MNAEEVGELTSALEKAENLFVGQQLQSSPHVAQLQAFVNDILPLLDASKDDEQINHPKFSKGNKNEWRKRIKKQTNEVNQKNAGRRKIEEKDD